MSKNGISKLFLIIFIFLKLSINQEENQKYLEGYITPPIKLFGAIEASGTKILCAVIDVFGNIIVEITMPTTTPEETTDKMLEFFKSYKISALGIGTFGPIDLDPKSPTYGSILNSPKLSWKGFNYLTAFKSLNVPIGIDTNANAACLGETTYGASRGSSNVLYVSIGTGIGVGIISEGQLVHGMMHPEGGHILIKKRADDNGESVCPYHDRCFEGLASGPSILKRYGKPGIELVGDEKVWDLEADYISQALVNYIMILQPQKIILAGGIMHEQILFPLIRKKVAEKINEYVKTIELENMDEYIIPCSLDDEQGILGSFKMALDKYEESIDK